ncbi:MAG: VCBS repeat-containing protein [Saprospirales bacterium]|nr:VCBS repeat-containing protein [Saprospirales bacterium]
MRFSWLSLGLSLLILSCSNEEKGTPAPNSSDQVQVFQLLSPAQTGITFDNAIEENEYQNHLISDVIFNGAGVGVIDVNNDGLLDLFFAGNQVSDRLYLNKGNLQFEDITASAGLVNDTWSTGVAVADVNGDGWMDLYVCKYMLPDPEKRRNVLYINNKNNTFTEEARKYGIDDPGHGTAANFFDYDKDGWLDLYIGIQPFVTHYEKTSGLEKQIDKANYSDRLFHNNGNGTFTDVTIQAGISNYAYTLSATVSDLNNDGWPDIYVANDYDEPDNFYQNNKDGTFTDIARLALRHMSNFSMGADLADFNNDGWMDIYVADMVAADNYRLKANMGGMNPEKFQALADAGFHYQYMFNMLQLNNGTGTFSEIAQMAGISNTDWSWATLFADYDNDGDKDLLITNGLVKDIKNKDYKYEINHLLDSLSKAEIGKANEKLAFEAINMSRLVPSVKLPNYLFANTGDLTFQNNTKVWGMSQASWSNGAVYADLDNDGDLDVAISNIHDPAFIYENQSRQQGLGNYLQLDLVGNQGNNLHSYGAKAWVYAGNTMQVQEVSPTRGYFSATGHVLHFGLGDASEIDSIVVKWPNGSTIKLEKVSANQRLTLKQKDGQPGDIAQLITERPLFQYVPQNAGIDLIYRENPFDDYAREILLPHRMSSLGPCTASGDVNGDRLEDFFIGGSVGNAGVLYLQTADGSFVRSPSAPWTADQGQEDIHAHFFDADGDRDKDLYLVSGGNEFPEGSPQYQDRLYLNDGHGQFSKATGALPPMPVSGGVAKSGDFDGDGDLDLFVGGRQVPGKYGFPAKSFILRNDKGRFTDITAEVAPELAEPGMVTDAQWLDWDKDGDLDLIVVGEWMPLSFFENTGGQLRNVTVEKGMENTAGWWNRIEKVDMDADGDTDLVVGNLGLNIKYKASEERPFRLFVKDFDANGTNDVYLGYYDSDGVCYPVRGRQCSSQQMPYISNEFKNYDAFAKAPIEQVLGDRKEGALERACQIFETVYLENQGDGVYVLHKLPNAAQISPAFGIACYDWNNDGYVDIALTGNYYQREVETTRSDAGSGCLLLGDGKGNFQALPPFKSGLLAVGDARSSEIVFDRFAKPMLLVANNSSYVQVFRPY